MNTAINKSGVSGRPILCRETFGYLASMYWMAFEMTMHSCTVHNISLNKVHIPY